jgi:hypothetical protein
MSRLEIAVDFRSLSAGYRDFDLAHSYGKYPQDQVEARTHFA